MKKLVLSLAVVFAVGMVSCGGGEKKCEDTNCDTQAPVEVVDETAVVEEVAGDSNAAPADTAAQAETPAEGQAN